MATYTVRHDAPKGHPLPPLLADIGTFVEAQPHGALGWFDAFGPEPIPDALEPAAPTAFRCSGPVFTGPAEGSRFKVSFSVIPPTIARSRRESLSRTASSWVLASFRYGGGA